MALRAARPLCGACAPPPPPPRPWGCRGRSGPGQEGGGAGDPRPGAPRGLYELLGVAPGATQAQVKAAYYRQSFLYHPDRNAGSEAAAQRFTRVHEAYLVLGSAALRRKYDRGLLSREDLRAASKPSGKEARARPPAPAPRWKPAQAAASASGSAPPGRPVFDFDAFYRAHYGEQLERERGLRERRREWQKRQAERREWTRPERLQELAAAALFFSVLAVFFSLK
ncbi:dnaJ homolog subfamily C member 30, mitochondrial [Elgaria multicarinata webbii]|uniref:dnaJ homolog subfamily C member 30, mitochondrial n=1 Tax=Elgaria multicarinata webbii TaxID=159646 RepID=UPI002FCCD03A